MVRIQLSGGEVLSLSSYFVGFDRPAWENEQYFHPHFRVRMNLERSHIDPHLKNLSHSFNYWGSRKDAADDKERLESRDLVDAVICFCADAAMWDANRDFVEFCQSSGWVYITDYEYAMSAYKECKKSYQQYQRLFGLDWSVQETLEEYLSKMED